MSSRQVPSRRQRGSSFRLRKRRDRLFFEALEGCADRERLVVRPKFTYSPPVVAARFGHLYADGLDKHSVESMVWEAVLALYPDQLVAMDPQRLGTPTAAFDLHFHQQHLSQKQDLRNKGVLPVNLWGKQQELFVSMKATQVSPCLAEVVVKQLDPRWVRKGATAALLAAAGYSADVSVQSEHTGDLPQHLSCFSSDMGIGRSDVIVAKVAAPASDPSLRKLPRSIQFQGMQVSISVSRSLQNKHAQRQAQAADTQQAGKQAAKHLKRRQRLQQQRQLEQQHQQQRQKQSRAEQMRDPTVPDELLVGVELLLAQADGLVPAAVGVSALETTVASPAPDHAHVPEVEAVDAGASSLSLAVATASALPEVTLPSAGKRRGPESASVSFDEAEALVASSLAIVPFTPDGAHGHDDSALRRSAREHKKPRPYYASNGSDPPDKVGKGLQRGFFK